MRRPPLYFHEIYGASVAAELLLLSRQSAKPYGVLLLSSVTALAFHGIVPASHLALWLSTQLLASLLSLRFDRRCRALAAVPVSPEALQRLELASLPYALASGITWGGLGLLMTPDHPSLNLFVLIVFLAVPAMAAAIQIASPARGLLLLATGLCMFLPVLYQIYPQDWHWITAVLLFINLVLARNSRQKSDVVADNIRLRQLQEELLWQQSQATEDATRANRDKSAFLAATSHDLRQPLHALMLTSHALSLRVTEGESRAMVDRVLEAGRALTQQFDSLMDLSRLESGEYQLQPQRLALAPLLQRALAARQPVAESRGLRLKLRMDRRVADVALQTDIALLARIIDNFIDNAIKYSPPGTGILLAAGPRGQELRMAVYDQGIGIALESQEQVFRPYVQIDNPTRDASRGIGLGLSIAWNAAALIGGRIRLRSRPGRGSQFALLLPSALVRETLPELDTLPAVSTESLRGRRLLLVEDDSRVAVALVAWLQNWGLQVTHYADPREVPDQLVPDLILSDVRLPGERDGIQWLSQWLVQWPEARGFLLSGEVSAVQQADHEGLAMLTKPVDPDQLLRALVGMVQAS